MPQALALVMRRLSSCIRSGVRATSMPPDSVKTPSALYCSVESLVSSNISREYSIGKMKLDAWPVRPPGFGSGPLSTRTMSRQPSSASGGPGCCRRCLRLLLRRSLGSECHSWRSLAFHPGAFLSAQTLLLCVGVVPGCFGSDLRGSRVQKRCARTPRRSSPRPRAPPRVESHGGGSIRGAKADSSPVVPCRYGSVAG